MEQLDAEFAYSLRHRAPLSFILADLDHFKQLNDTRGHLTGDEVLRGVGDHLKGTVRREDFAARYGGEEFAIVCRGTTAEVAVTVAERIRTLIQSSQLVADQPAIKVTISAGVATFPEDAAEAAALIECADQALYEAKEGGRNRVIACTSACPA